MRRLAVLLIASAIVSTSAAHAGRKNPSGLTDSGIHVNLANRVELRVDGAEVTRRVTRGTRPTGYSPLALVERKGRVSLTGAEIEPDNISRIYESY